ncbi:P-loop containing nucleoside triphosphate hydrolase protein [Crucibulum laeve]|uniref:DNA 3'-5' helicase n=1 Tax=Crucibulum laeve TaxID=68775 RepID=A0A5C3M508_9AGAR|nr:P-loop containing nucleoside triphosphate hydrolase protein [Crucibulum laeve]
MSSNLSNHGPQAPTLASFLSSLNPAQLQAVKHDPQVPLQILAGPGSGKTKVLTSRIAHLILAHSLPPSSICAVTFTNKAANEMRERLTKLIGEERTSQVRMGTFHALCAMFLRKYSRMVGLEGNFTVCDADESKKLIATLLKPYKDYLAGKDMTLKEGTVLSMISKAKAKGQSPADYREHIHESNKKDKKTGLSQAEPDDVSRIVAEVYDAYERALRKSNSLDFDDLLVFGVKLFTTHRPAVAWCKHVLVDEFQDTNTTQYDLMQAIAVAKCITIVGDPDQSIYGWRSAEVANLAKMQKDFASTKQIFLEENYRSTGAILNTSIAIVAQDKARIQKTLHTSHPAGTTPVLRAFENEYEEASFIAVEIKRLVASMGGVLRWGDFVVLLRFNALSRTIESALQKEGIPSRVLAGHKFFERLEIKDLLSYLQLVDNPSFNPAFIRAVGVPSRGIGEKTLAEFVSRAEKMQISQLQVAEKIHDGKIPDIKPPVKRKLDSFVKTIKILRTLTEKGTSPAELIRRLLELLDYENYLKKTQPDWESRWENVQELITFATEAEVEVSDIIENPHMNLIDVDSEDAVVVEPKETPLRLFLQASMLSSEGDNQTEEDNKEKVTISTCHAAKGLEWSVVIVPSVEQGTFPFYRTDDIEEERRLLYVACTRAQGLLYLTHAEQRKFGGEAKKKDLSEFVSAVTKQNPSLFTNQTPNLPTVQRDVISRVLGRPPADEAEVRRRCAEFERTTRRRVPQKSDSANKNSWNPTFSRQRPIGTNPIFFPFRNMLAGPEPSSPNTLSSVSIPPAAFTSRYAIPPHAAPSKSYQQSHSNPTLISHLNQNLPPAFVNPAFSNLSTITSRVGTGPINSFVNPSLNSQQPLQTVSTGVKRRLGMGPRTAASYSNKKFKPPI